MHTVYVQRGFLPSRDPLLAFPPESPLAVLDELGHDLPSLLVDNGFRARARRWSIPEFREPEEPKQRLEWLRLYYVRLGFLASGYVNQVGQPPVNVLPANLAVPLCKVCRLLERPPILSYDGYALYNWKRFDPAGPVALGNIDTIQNFVHLYDEHWFILVHVEIEALAAEMLTAIDQLTRGLRTGKTDAVDPALRAIGQAMWRQVGVLRRIPEKMDPSLYYRTFRPYIRFFEHVVYEGVDAQPLNFRGETGAQSSILPMLVALMKIPHQPSPLVDHLADMRHFMPAEHRTILEETQQLPDIKPWADKEAFNDLLEAMATFREIHLGYAQEYINKRVPDPRGTGGTPYMQWLGQLIGETRAHKIG